MNKKLLEQLALAKEAGTKAMAKDFFAPVPGAAEPDGDEAMPPEGGGSVDVSAQAEGLTPEQLEELMRALGGGAGGGGGA